MHIYDGERFPPARPGARMQPDARVAGIPAVAAADRHEPRGGGAARRLSHRQRGDARRAGPARAAGARHRGGASRPSPTPSSRRMRTSGVRGIRFTQFDPKTAATTLDMIEPLAKRVEPLGLARADPSARRPDRRRRRPAAAAARHHRVRSSRPARRRGMADPAFGVIRRMLDKRQHLDEALGRLHVRRPAALCRGGADRAGLYQGGAGAHGVGQRLAAPDRKGQAGRRGAVRPARRLGAGRGDAAAHPGRQPGEALRFPK